MSEAEAIRKYLEIAHVRIDGGTQPRAEISEDTVEEYAEAIRDKHSFPPIVVFNDGATLWLADGFHRFHATRRAGLPTVFAEVRAGSRRDAMLYAFGANTRHGLRETRADKHRKVEAMLRDQEWQQWSDREIGRRCGVNHGTVGSVRAELELDGEIRHVDSRTFVTRHGTTTTRTQPTSSAVLVDGAEVLRQGVDSERPSAQPLPAPPAPTPSNPPAPDAMPKPAVSSIFAEGSGLSAWVLAARATNAISQINRADPNAISGVESISLALDKLCAVIGAPVTSDGERLRAEIAELHDRMAEMGKHLEEANGENEVLRRIAEAENQVKAALEEVRRVSEHNRILEERVRGLTGEKAEAITAAKRWKRQAEKAEKVQAGRA